MSHRRNMLSLYLYYGVFFVGCGFTMYTSRYLGGVGLDNGQIGMIMAAPAFVSIFAQPVWGMIADRSPRKKYTIVAGFLLAALCAFAAHACAGRYIPLLIMWTLLNTMTLPAAPVGNSIAIEYTAQTGASFGPVRMSGTLGYQLCILASGFLLGEQMKGFFAVYGVILLGCGLCAVMLPPTQGHQHGGEKVPLSALLKNRELMVIFVLAFLAQVVAQFFNSFFTKYLGDLGISNAATGVITTLVVVLEIPFLLFCGDRLYRKLPIFTWMWLGLLVNGLRFVALAHVHSPALILLTQLSAVFLFACFEFFPVLCLSEIVSREVLGTAQSMYQMVCFGLARIVGASVGGWLAEGIGIGAVFNLGGWMLLIAALVTFAPLCRRRKA